MNRASEQRRHSESRDEHDKEQTVHVCRGKPDKFTDVTGSGIGSHKQQETDIQVQAVQALTSCL